MIRLQAHYKTLLKNILHFNLLAFSIIRDTPLERNRRQPVKMQMCYFYKAINISSLIILTKLKEIKCKIGHQLYMHLNNEGCYHQEINFFHYI